MLSLIRPGKASPAIPGTHFTQTPLGPQLLKPIVVKEPTLEDCWTDYETRALQRERWP
jgi:hypothetical protein